MTDIAFVDNLRLNLRFLNYNTITNEKKKKERLFDFYTSRFNFLFCLYFWKCKYNNIYAILYKQHHLNHKSGTYFFKRLICRVFCKFDCVILSTLKITNFLTKQHHLIDIFGVNYSNSNIYKPINNM